MIGPPKEVGDYGLVDLIDPATDEFDERWNTSFRTSIDGLTHGQGRRLERLFSSG